MLLHPLMLAWLAGAVLPMVLHLLSRSRYRSVPWGAMMFLTGPDAGPQRSGHLRQWCLLAIRMAMVGTLAVALARPVLSASYAWIPSAGLTTGGPAAAVIILDDSASMGYTRDGASRLDLAKQATLQILASLKRGDQASLLLSGARDYQPPLPPGPDLQSIAGRVAELQPDSGECNFAADLLKAADLLDHAEPAERQIYLICDRQALNWRDLNDAFGRQWKYAHSGARSAPNLTVIPVGENESDNIAVDGLDIPEHVVIRDQLIAAQVRVRNYGPATVDAIPLSVWTGNRTLSDTTISVPAHSARSVSVPIRFGELGSRVISAAVKTTGLTTDDRLDYSVDVIETPRVLIVTASDSTSRPAEELPGIFSAGAGRNPDGFSTVPVSALTEQSFTGCNCIVLDDVARLPAKRLADLKSFIAAGGGVLILPGVSVTSNDYNRDLLGDPGILHATLSKPIARTVHLGSFDRQHPVFKFLAARSDLPGVFPINRYFPAIVHGTTRVIARLGSGEPLMLESANDHGRVILLAAEINRDSSRKLEPLMHAIVRYLSTALAVDRNLSAGQQILVATTEPVEDRTAVVQYVTGGTRDPAVVTHLPDHAEIRYTKTNRPGQYRLRYRVAGKDRILNYIAGTGHAESDLTPLTSVQWSALNRRIRFATVDQTQTTIAQAMQSQRGGREIWIDLLGAVLVMMIAEMVVSRWWSG